jgi:flagellar biosynthetic protein FliR
MERLLELPAQDLPLFLLVFFRMAGLMVAAPLFGSAVIPPAAKAFLALVLAVLLFPLAGRPGAPPSADLGTLALAAAGETAVGLIIGFAAALLFAAAQYGGQLVDQEMGLMMANVVDPISNEMVSVVGQFKMFFSMIVWLLIDGHHFLLQAAAESFATIPPMGASLPDAAALHAADTMMGSLFRVAVQVAAPAAATLFLVTVATAFIARAVPEMNVFVLGFGLRMAVGLVALAVGTELFVRGFSGMSLEHGESVRKLMELMGG